jgi:hypothetical protein
MKNLLLAMAFIVAGAAFAQPSFAAAEEPAPGVAEPVKAKPAKHKTQRHSPKHEHHSSMTKAHKAG